MNNEKYYVGSVGDWWIARPPSFQSLDAAAKFYLDGSAKKKFCEKECFIGEEVEFTIGYDEGIVFRPIGNTKVPHYLVKMYVGSDVRDFSGDAHLTRKYETLDSLIGENPNILGMPNHLILRQLEIKVGETK